MATVAVAMGLDVASNHPEGKPITPIVTPPMITPIEAKKEYGLPPFGNPEEMANWVDKVLIGYPAEDVNKWLDDFVKIYPAGEQQSIKDQILLAVNDCCSIANQFEKGLYNLPPGERVAIIKTAVQQATIDLGLTKSSRLSQINGRDVYTDNNGNLLALDTQHGRWESINPKTGAHQGEVTLHTLTPIPNSLDSSGKHDLKVK